MKSKTLLALKVEPSFEGRLSIRLVEEPTPDGQVSYSLACEKAPPLNAAESNILLALATGNFGIDDFKDIKKVLIWERKLPELEAKNLMTTLGNAQIPVVAESPGGLDGTTYQLVIGCGHSLSRFQWWCEPPSSWAVIGKVARTLITWADASSAVQELPSNTRRELIRKLGEKLEEARRDLERQGKESIAARNRRFHELAQVLKAEGLTCPHCGRHSKDVRFIERTPDSGSCFICRSCGRSFRVEEL